MFEKVFFQRMSFTQRFAPSLCASLVALALGSLIATPALADQKAKTVSTQKQKTVKVAAKPAPKAVKKVAKPAAKAPAKTHTKPAAKGKTPVKPSAKPAVKYAVKSQDKGEQKFAKPVGKPLRIERNKEPAVESVQALPLKTKLGSATQTASVAGAALAGAGAALAADHLLGDKNEQPATEQSAAATPLSLEEQEKARIRAQLSGSGLDAGSAAPVGSVPNWTPPVIVDDEPESSDTSNQDILDTMHDVASEQEGTTADKQTEQANAKSDSAVQNVQKTEQTESKSEDKNVQSEAVTTTDKNKQEHLAKGKDNTETVKSDKPFVTEDKAQVASDKQPEAKPLDAAVQNVGQKAEGQVEAVASDADKQDKSAESEKAVKAESSAATKPEESKAQAAATEEQAAPAQEAKAETPITVVSRVPAPEAKQEAASDASTTSVAASTATPVVEQPKQPTEPAKLAFEPYVEAYPPKVTPLMGFTPYVTTVDDVKNRFKEQATFNDKGSLGIRSLIVSLDLRLGDVDVYGVNVFYTKDKTISEMYFSLPADKRGQVLHELRTYFKEVSPLGYWRTRTDHAEVWRDATTEVIVYPTVDKEFSVEYGAIARVARETSNWMDTTDQPLRFAGLDLKTATLEDLKKKVGKHCKGPVAIDTGSGSMQYTMEGSCFGLPGETGSMIWMDENRHYIKRLVIDFSTKKKDVQAVRKALSKRYTYSEDLGQFKVGQVNVRNIWVPMITLNPTKGELDFQFYRDGVRQAHTEWLAHLKDVDEESKLSETVDKLFE